MAIRKSVSSDVTRWPRVIAIVAALMTLALPAAAQDRAFVGGLGGVTFHTVSSGIVAANGGVPLGQGVFVIGEVGRAANVLPREISDDLDDAEALIEQITGLPVNIRVRLPATYAFGGIRWFAPGTGRFRPFVEGGIGVARLSAKVRASVGGIPVPDEIIEDVGQLDLESNEVLLTLGGGVTYGLSRAVSVDAGYRYMHAAVQDASSAHTSVLFAGVRIGFGG